jgi:hypothetical protein
MKPPCPALDAGGAGVAKNAFWQKILPFEEYGAPPRVKIP